MRKLKIVHRSASPVTLRQESYNIVARKRAVIPSLMPKFKGIACSLADKCKLVSTGKGPVILYVRARICQVCQGAEPGKKKGHGKGVHAVSSRGPHRIGGPSQVGYVGSMVSGLGLVGQEGQLVDANTVFVGLAASGRKLCHCTAAD